MNIKSVIGFPKTPVLKTAAGTLLPTNLARVAVTLQNLGTDVAYVRLGPNAAPTAGNFDFVLPACTAEDDGTSPMVVFQGHVGVISVAGDTVRMVANEHTTTA